MFPRTDKCYIQFADTTAKPPWGVIVEEPLCSIEILKDNNNFVARIQSEYGGNREYKSSNFEEVLEQMTMDLQEEFESA